MALLAPLQGVSMTMSQCSVCLSTGRRGHVQSKPVRLGRETESRNAVCILLVRPSVMEPPFPGTRGPGAAGPGDTRPLGACRRLPREPGSYRASSTPQTGLLPTAHPGSSWRFPSLTAVEPPAVHIDRNDPIIPGTASPASSRSPAVGVYRRPGLVNDSAMGIVTLDELAGAGPSF